MSIYRRKSGRYAVLIDLDASAAGGRRRRSLGTYRTRKEAEHAEREALEARDRGIDLSPNSVTVAEVVERFLAEARTRLSPTTTHRYEEVWRLHALPWLGALPLAKIRPTHIADVYARLQSAPIFHGRPLNPRTVLHVHRLLHRVFGWAERRNLIERNIVRAVDPPRPGPSPARALTGDEADAFLSLAESHRLYPFFALATVTGMRRGEIAALKWDAFDSERGVLSVRQAIGDDRQGGYFLKPTKTGRERVVPLGPIGATALRRQRAQQAQEKLAAGEAYCDQGFIFADEIGEPLDLDAPTRAFKVLARKAGIPWARLHDLRHTAATWALASGADVRSVSAVLGHSAPSTTLNVYGHVVAGLQLKAVEAIDATLERARSRRARGA